MDITAWRHSRGGVAWHPVANSEAFFETGSWDQDAREALYQKAKRQMYNRCYTRENIRIAEENAKEQLAQFVKAMGFEHVKVNLR